MRISFFVSDLHGRVDRYHKLIGAILKYRPIAVFLGGDLLPSGKSILYKDRQIGDFFSDYLIPELHDLRYKLGDSFPNIFLILGNDDRRVNEVKVVEGEGARLWHYIHNKKVQFEGFNIFGYAYVPPTPFMLKDWERYDVSRYVDPGCISPEDGWRTVQTPEMDNEIPNATIKADLNRLTASEDMDEAMFLFHSPPYQTNLDRANLDGKIVDGVQVDVHVGSIAIKRFIEQRQPFLTLHGHVHESARITGTWKEKIGRTTCLSAAHDGPELALVQFELDAPEQAIRELL